ncbi:type II secretion system F family protein [Microbacterium sp. 1.5R]|uniref:type II secretion system F family protein n=1 Tax=Microbacterium sp. 1.5R TaxID=1916917 RepID=UPI00119F3CDE|nr:type II secretion system F family protein [Microbacterium sp. 1.5R]
MSALSAVAFSVLGGGVLAAGLLLILSVLPRWSAVPLMTRIAPYVRDAVADETVPRAALPIVRRLPATQRTVIARAITVCERALGGSDSLARRLAQAGIDVSATMFRARQLGWLVAGIGVGAVVVVTVVVAGRMSPPVALLPLVLGAVAAVGYDMRLTARVASRRARLADELPTTLEFIALCLSAGETLLDSLRRVAAVGTGELTGELHRVVVAVATGSPLGDALRELASRLELAGLSRAVDQVIAALEHGAPLAAVLQAQAGDARDDAKRVLIEQAGRKEILMLLPLVFLILPLSVLFAIYPGLFILRLGIG